MKIKTIFLITISLLLNSCATTAGYEKILKSWVGSNINDCIKANGYPDNSFTAPNGNKVYVYRSAGSFTMPMQTHTTYNVYGNAVYGNSYTTGGETIYLSCQTYLEVNKKNIITSWQWKGNNCVA